LSPWSSSCPGRPRPRRRPPRRDTPREIVAELDKYVIGQKRAKKAVAIALRNRWRRQQLAPEMAREILPKNILMIGPTASARPRSRGASRARDAPFIKVEASKFTEVGYVGRDVESIVRDLTEVAVQMVRDEKTLEIREPRGARTEQRLLDLLLPALTDVEGEETRGRLRSLRDGKLEDRLVEVEVADKTFPSFEIVTDQGVEEMDINVKEMLPGLFGGKKKRRKTTVAEAREILQAEEEGGSSTRPGRARGGRARAVLGIVFSTRSTRSRGARRAAAARRVARGRPARPPADRRGHLRQHEVRVRQDGPRPLHRGRRVSRLEAVGPDPGAAGPLPDPRRARLADRGGLRPHPDGARERPAEAVPRAARGEGVDLSFSDEAVGEIARDAERVNRALENIGARRLHTILERLLEDISFAARRTRASRSASSSPTSGRRSPIS
jgi:ATP-dependent HslUV protease ATP-binding subunit HslU